MKKEDKPTHKETDKSKSHENQNIHDFNPSQFTTEEELEIIKKKKEEAKKEDNKSSEKKKS